jgi:hypothetical protein
MSCTNTEGITITPEMKAALARKKRKEILSKESEKNVKISPSTDVFHDDDNDDVDDDHDMDLVPNTTSSSSKVKFLKRYDPSEPMTKEEEVQWRREARKQRNRARYCIHIHYLWKCLNRFLTTLSFFL